MSSDNPIAATGKQQVGEAQGDATQPWPAVDTVLADAYVTGSEGSEFDMIAARKAISAALAARKPVGQEPIDAIERIARLLWLRSCNRHHDGSPFTGWDALGETLKEYSRKEAREYEALRNNALWPAGRENYTPSGVIR